MGKFVDVVSLGGDKVKMNNTFIEFVDENSGMLKTINTQILEGKENTLQVKKEEGTYRPFLVVEDDELHARIAVYMSSNYTESRMEPDNAIRGQHIIKTPPMLANYIASSSIKGTLANNKISIIDRDRFFFFTDDSYVETDSRAIDKNDLKIGLGLHVNNLRYIREFLGVDLGGNRFSRIIKGGGADILTFVRTEGRPIIYNPSANYVSLFINTLERYSNYRHNVSPKNLLIMGEVGNNAIDAYHKYLKFQDSLKTIERQNPKLYQALQNVRYYSNMITPASYEYMQENARKNKSSKYKYIYGDPIKFGVLPISERIKIEFSRLKIKGNKKDLAQYVELVESLIKQESEVKSLLSESSQEIIKFLNMVNKEERIILNDFPYSENFWNGFYSKYNEEGYIESLKTDIRQKYLMLSYRYNEDKKRVKQEDELKRKQKKLTELQERQKREQIKSQKLELVKVLVNRYWSMYGRAFKQYNEGKLLPITIDEISNYKQIVNANVPINPNVVGKGLGQRMVHELQVMESLKPMIESNISMALTSEKSIIEKQNQPNEKMLIEIMGVVCDIEKKISKHNKQMPEKDRLVLVEKEVKDYINGLDDEELEELISEDFNFGLGSEEILTCMQDIYNIRSSFRAINSLRSVKRNILEEISELNNPNLLNEYNQSIEVVGELKLDSNFVKAMGFKSMEEVESIISSLEAGLNNKTPTIKDYEMIVEQIKAQKVQIKKQIDSTKRLSTIRNLFYQKLDKYEIELEKVLPECYKIADKIIAETIKKSKIDLKDISHFGVKKLDDGSYARVLNDEIVGSVEKDEVEENQKEYLKETKFALNKNFFTRPDDDKQIIAEIFSKMYPTREQMVENLKSELLKAKTLDEAVAVYKNHLSILENFERDCEDFKDIIENEYREYIQSVQDIAVSMGGFKMMIKVLDLHFLFNLVPEGDLGVNYNLYKNAIKQSCIKYCECMDGDYEKFVDELHKHIHKIVNNMETRIKKEGLETALSRSTVKATYFNRVNMPKSIISENGIADSVLSLQELKFNRQNLLARYSEYLVNVCEIEAKKRLNREITEETLKELERVGLKPEELRKIEDCTLNRLGKLFEEELIKIQKSQISKLTDTLFETVRCYANKGNTEYNFVMNDDGLIRYLKRELVNGEGSCLATIQKLRHSEFDEEDVDFINITVLLVNNIDDIRDHIIKNIPYEDVQPDNQLMATVEGFYRRTIAKNYDEAQFVKMYGNKIINGEDD